MDTIEVAVVLLAGLGLFEVGLRVRRDARWATRWSGASRFFPLTIQRNLLFGFAPIGAGVAICSIAIFMSQIGVSRDVVLAATFFGLLLIAIGVLIAARMPFAAWPAWLRSADVSVQAKVRHDGILDVIASAASVALALFVVAALGMQLLGFHVLR